MALDRRLEPDEFTPNPWDQEMTRSEQRLMEFIEQQRLRPRQQREQATGGAAGPDLSPKVPPVAPPPATPPPVGRGLPWQDLLKIFGPLAGVLGGRAVMGGGAGTAASVEMPQELKKLLALQRHRINQSQPNYELMLRMAQGLQPQWARSGAPSPDRVAVQR